MQIIMKQNAAIPNYTFNSDDYKTFQNYQEKTLADLEAD